MKEHVLLWKAIHDLEIDLPVLAYEILSPTAIRLSLYGGRVVEYAVPPPEAQVEIPAAAPEKGNPRRRVP